MKRKLPALLALLLLPAATLPGSDGSETAPTPLSASQILNPKSEIPSEKDASVPSVRNPLSPPPPLSLETARYGVMLGSVQEQHARALFPRASLTIYHEFVDMLAPLKQGKIDLVFAMETQAWRALRDNPSLEQELIPALGGNPVAAAFRHEDAALLARFNAALDDWSRDGTLADMRRRWLSTNASVPPMPRIPSNAPADAAPLRVGVQASNEPIVFRDASNRPAGYSAEIALRFAQRLNRPVVFSELEFTSLIAALKTRKIDAIIDSMCPTPERAKQVAFSQPYLRVSNAILKRRGTPLSLNATPTSPAQPSSSEIPNLKSEIPPRTPFASPAPSVDNPAAPSLLQSLRSAVHDNLIRENRWRLILNGLGVTLLISTLSLLLGTVLGFGVCALNMSRNPLLRRLGSLYLAFFRGTPVLVLLLLLFYVAFARVNIHAVPVAIIAFSLNAAAFIGEIIRAAILQVDRGQIEAARSLGYSRAGAFRLVTLPQAARSALPVYKSEFISLIKSTAIVGYIAIQDLTRAGDIIRSRTFDAFFPLLVVAAIYLLITALGARLFDFIGLLANHKTRSAP